MATLERLNTSYTSRTPARKSWGGTFKKLLSGGGKSSKKDNSTVSLCGDFGNDSAVLRRRNTTMDMGVTDPASPANPVKIVSADELFAPPKPNTICELCEGRRLKAARLEREIEKMRDLIINDPIVKLEPPENVDTDPELLELFEESVKLRITIDSLMRFQDFAIADSR